MSPGSHGHWAAWGWARRQVGRREASAENGQTLPCPLSRRSFSPGAPQTCPPGRSRRSFSLQDSRNRKACLATGHLQPGEELVKRWRFQFLESRGAACPEDQIRLSVSLSQTNHPAGGLPLPFSLEEGRNRGSFHGVGRRRAGLAGWRG